ncbi:hypothetical protein Mgra_00001650 [Meloidogyne graminicola]|uniref:Transmembrane protein n=1 Tax=Meloidogyne graminicola TaxID=189291 RepID=A0A8S9ZYS6_9BILA|nr:hypothetical protein Mgra_00001650 [Meloidogyne graminicola]
MQNYNFFHFLLSTTFVFFFIITKGSTFSESTKEEELSENVDCIDDGRLFDTSFVGVLIALIVILFWHIIRICCISRMAAAHHPSTLKPPVEPLSSANKTNSLEIQVEDEENIREEQSSNKSNTNAECS